MSEEFKAFTEDEIKAACAEFGAEANQKTQVVVSALQWEVSPVNRIVDAYHNGDKMPHDMIIVKRNRTCSWGSPFDSLGIPVHYDQRWTRPAKEDAMSKEKINVGDEVRYSCDSGLERICTVDVVDGSTLPYRLVSGGQLVCWARRDQVTLVSKDPPTFAEGDMARVDRVPTRMEMEVEMEGGGLANDYDFSQHVGCTARVHTLWGDVMHMVRLTNGGDYFSFPAACLSHVKTETKKASPFAEGATVRVDRVPTQEECTATRCGDADSRHWVTAIGKTAKFKYLDSDGAVCLSGHPNLTYVPPGCLSLVEGDKKRKDSAAKEIDKGDTSAVQPPAKGSVKNPEKDKPEPTPAFEDLTCSAVFQTAEGVEMSSPMPGDGWRQEGGVTDYRDRFYAAHIGNTGVMFHAMRKKNGLDVDMITTVFFDVVTPLTNDKRKVAVTHDTGMAWLMEGRPEFDQPLRVLEVTLWRRLTPSPTLVEHYEVQDRALAKYLS